MWVCVNVNQGLAIDQKRLSLSHFYFGGNNMYYKQVDKRYRESMGKFLRKHFRYNTMNSWNRSASYANCIKLHYVNKPDDIDNNTW